MKQWLAAIATAFAVATFATSSLARPGGPGPGPGPAGHPHGMPGPGPVGHGPGWRPAPPPPGFGPGPRYWHHDYYDLWPIGVGLLAITAAKQSNPAPIYDPLTMPPTVSAPAQPAAPVNININTGNANASTPQQGHDYFYCPASHGYYPTVPLCPTGWVKISPQG